AMEKGWDTGIHKAAAGLAGQWRGEQREAKRAARDRAERGRPQAASPMSAAEVEQMKRDSAYITKHGAKAWLERNKRAEHGESDAEPEHGAEPADTPPPSTPPDHLSESPPVEKPADTPPASTPPDHLSESPPVENPADTPPANDSAERPAKPSEHQIERAAKDAKDKKLIEETRLRARADFERLRPGEEIPEGLLSEAEKAERAAAAQSEPAPSDAHAEHGGELVGAGVGIPTPADAADPPGEDCDGSDAGGCDAAADVAELVGRNDNVARCLARQLPKGMFGAAYVN
ncbi:unnamed protein product, partial [marine sediment metagenome]